MKKNERTQLLKKIEARVCERSKGARTQYLSRLQQVREAGKHQGMSCGNLAHGYAACDKGKRPDLLSGQRKNFAIVSAYNDVLSAHHPYIDYPHQIQNALSAYGVSAQFAAGVPAMCDGVTQGRPGMELSLFSRDVIAQSTAVALTHEIFDGVFCLGICDKIVPGLLIGALHFGHLPAVFVPSGPMPTGLSNAEKMRVRKSFAAGEASRKTLLEAEVKSYHSPGTCTFYGTANTNQLLLEAMGLQLSGASFEPPYSEKRTALTQVAVSYMIELENKGVGVGELVTERSIVRAMVALAASGGSTNHTIHLVAIARAAGIHIDWQDFSEVSKVTPLLARIYPNGVGDINDFHQAGGTPCLFKHLEHLGLFLASPTIMGDGTDCYFKRPELIDDPDVNKAKMLEWRQTPPVSESTVSESTVSGPTVSASNPVLADVGQVFDGEGGIRLLTGNLGRAIVKSSAVEKKFWIIQAPARVFNFVADLKQALESKQIKNDALIVLRYQGPKACGMPELHGLMPHLSNLLDQGLKVALITDGRMSGASGRVPVALHLTPEALNNSVLSVIKDGDSLLLDIETGRLSVQEDTQQMLASRIVKHPNLDEFEQGFGRELFKSARSNVTTAEEGACTW